MSKKDEFNNEYNIKRPQNKLTEFHKYYQDEEDSDLIFEDISTSKGTKMPNQTKNNKNVNFENNQILYNNGVNNNNNNIKKNPNYQQYNNNIPDNINNDVNSKYIDRNNGNYYVNNNNEMIKPKNSQKINNNNSDYICDNKIFTRIVPNFDNKTMKNKENISSIPCNNYSLNDNKTYDINQKKNKRSSDYIYSKSKTPKKKCIYHKNKNNNENNNNLSESSSIFSENNILDNIISSSRNNDNESKRFLDPKKLSVIIKNGIKKDLNSENDYIDLLTISDIKNIQKQNKLEESYPQKDYPVQEKINTNNNAAYPNNVSTPTDTNTSEMSEESLYSNKQGVIIFPKRNNHFLSKNNKNRKNLNRNNNKSYDCVVFKKKVGIIKKKKKKNKRNKTSDIYQDNNIDEKGTPIKKENIRGGIVVLYQNKFKKSDNKNLKSIKIKEKPNKPIPDNEYYIEEIKKVTISVTLIQKWWRRVYYKNIINIYDEIIYKKKKTNNLYISKQYYIMPYNEIIIIQNVFREHLRLKNIKNNELKRCIKYIPKDICQITKKRFKCENKNNNLIKHRYTKSKLCQFDINKILLSANEIKYETNNYIYLKKCHFRKRLNEDDEYEDEDDFNRRAFTCEIMRKIKINTNKRQLTPDTSNEHNIIKNPNLKVVKLAGTQYITNKRKRNNKLKEKPISSELINNKNNRNNKNYNEKNNLNNDNKNQNSNYKQTSNYNRYTNQKEKLSSNETKSNRQNHFINNNNHTNHTYKYSNNTENNGRYKNRENNNNNNNYRNNNIRDNNNKNNNNRNEFRNKDNNNNYKIYYSYYNNKKK